MTLIYTFSSTLHFINVHTCSPWYWLIFKTNESARILDFHRRRKENNETSDKKQDGIRNNRENIGTTRSLEYQTLKAWEEKVTKQNVGSFKNVNSIASYMNFICVKRSDILFVLFSINCLYERSVTKFIFNNYSSFTTTSNLMWCLYM